MCFIKANSSSCLFIHETFSVEKRAMSDALNRHVVSPLARCGLPHCSAKAGETK